VDVGAFCIDRTEVTNADYAEFLASGSSPPGSHPRCGWNTSYEPDTACGGQYEPEARPDHPVTCIDWCDAHDYCAWAGKRLCGAIGGGSHATVDWDEALISQWYFVCSQAGTTSYAYGASYDGGICATETGSTVKVGLFASCHGSGPPFSAVLDLAGNVAELTDSCGLAGNPANDFCHQRGSGFGNTPASGALYSSCTGDPGSGDFVTRGERNQRIGFRCCADE
jgi:formylglycine-generating enzyme required for sulfatase activity